jgi:hypothetical protein
MLRGCNLDTLKLNFEKLSDHMNAYLKVKQWLPEDG